METVILLAFLVALSIEDIRWKEVHNILLYAFLASGIIVWFIKGQVSFCEFAGGIICGILIMLFSGILPDRIGDADGIVFAATGAYLGLTHNLVLMITSTVLAGIGSMIAITVLKKDGDDTLPLIPFIAAGCVIVEVL